MRWRTALKSGAERLGLRPAHQTRHSQRALLLKHLGVDLVLDVGANIGQYAGIHLRSWTGYRGRIASFEPVSTCYAQCDAAAREDPLWTVFPYGLSDAARTVPITVPVGQEDLSSLHAFTDVGKSMMETTTARAEQVTLHQLDEVIGQVSSPTDRLALKLDVQGHEAAVLRGARGALTRVVLVECEMPLVGMYEGQDTLRALLALLAATGFSPVGMYSNYVDPATGYAMDADVLLVRQPG